MSDFERPDDCAIPKSQAPPRRLHLVCTSTGETSEHALCEKAVYTVGGEGKDIPLFGSRASTFHAVIYHDIKGKTFVYDLGSTHGIYCSKTRPNTVKCAYELMVNGKNCCIFGDPKDSLSIRAKLVDPSAPSTQEQAQPKAQTRTDVSNDGQTGTLKRTLDKALEPAPCTEPPAPVVQNSATHEASVLLENLFKTYQDDYRASPSKSPPRSTNAREPEPPPKRPRTDVSANRPVLGPALGPATAARPAVLAQPVRYANGIAPERSANHGSVAAGPKYSGAPERTNASANSSATENRAPAGPARPACIPRNGPAPQREVFGPQPPPANGRQLYGTQIPAPANDRSGNDQRDARGSREVQRPQAQEAAANKSKSNGKCDKCDGPHPTDRCPNFKKVRENHKDAWANYGKEHPGRMGSSGGNFVLRGASVIRQPGDGSCLFHSLCYGLKALGTHENASQLRNDLAHFIRRNPKQEIAGDTLEEWVSWDSNSTVNAYTQRMAAGRAWGGGIEIAACALAKKANIHVYEKKGGEIRRISCFETPVTTRRVVHILYQGGTHYDALSVR